MKLTKDQRLQRARQRLLELRKQKQPATKKLSPEQTVRQWLVS